MRTILLVGLCMELGACASTDGSRRAVLASDDIDVQKVVTVNDWAHRRGAKVIWLRYPMRPHPQAETDGDSP